MIAGDIGALFGYASDRNGQVDLPPSQVGNCSSLPIYHRLSADTSMIGAAIFACAIDITYQGRRQVILDGTAQMRACKLYIKWRH